MKKSDLKTGMVVECRNGKRYIVMNDRFLSISGYNLLSSYISELLMKRTPLTEYLSEYGIMKIYKPQLVCLDLRYVIKDLIWERSDVKEITMAEVEEKFGCKVKIIKE